MRYRYLLGALGCALLAAARPVVAQGGAARDAISGTWRGHMGPGPVPQFAVTLDLKFDGTSTVTGSLEGLPSPGEVKKGTFDPATGALKLEVGARGEGPERLFLDGTVVLGTATGRVRDTGDQTGTFRLTSGGGGAQSGGADAAAELRRSFGEVSAWVSKAAELVPADKYTYRPAATVRTFGQLIAHVSDGYAYYCGRASGKNLEWSDATEKGATDRATVVAKLKQALEVCNAAYSGSGQVGALVDNVAHTSLHYGNIITYVRMLGLVPPSS